MTTYHQPPIMDQRHIVTLQQVRSLWPYPQEIDLRLVHDIILHLEALVDAPVPAKSTDPTRYNGEHQQGQNTGSAFDDWRLEYKPLTEPYESDQ